MRKTVMGISLIVNYKLNYKDDNIKLHMKSLSTALVPNRKARFSHVIVHGSQIYTLLTHLMGTVSLSSHNLRFLSQLRES